MFMILVVVHVLFSAQLKRLLHFTCYRNVVYLHFIARLLMTLKSWYSLLAELYFSRS